MKIAILPGSYDPMTVGHLEIARRASAVYDKIYIAVMINAKKSICLQWSKELRSHVLPLKTFPMQRLFVTAECSPIFTGDSVHVRS